MKRFFLWLAALVPILLSADSDPLSTDAEEPTTCHHVNVITGDLNLSMQDMIVSGAKPITITRTYSSSGALEIYNSLLSFIRTQPNSGWVFQGGWNLLPHLQLVIEPSLEKDEFTIYLAEPNGHWVVYLYSHKQAGSKTWFFKPRPTSSSISGCLHARENPANHLLEIDFHKQQAILHLANGGKRCYSKTPHSSDPKHSKKIEDQTCLYLLTREIFPDKHRLDYQYDDDGNLAYIKSLNPSGRKTYASIEIHRNDPKQDSLHIHFQGSDGQRIHYQTTTHENRYYLNAVTGNSRPSEHVHFIPSRKKTGVRIGGFDFGNQRQFDVSYFCPKDSKQAQECFEEPYRKEIQIDRVQSISEPVGPNGEKVEVASFSYSPNQTDVRDSEGLLTRYCYHSGHIASVEYFDKNDTLHSSQKFYWDDYRLRCKAVFNEHNEPLFAKTFVYDQQNVAEETLWGNLSGNLPSPLQIDDQGHPSGAESYKKTYSYWESSNLIRSESEEDGPSFEYFYKQDTDLLECKLTKDADGHIRLREFFAYDADNLLILEIVDDGSSLFRDDLGHVTQRLEKHYQLNSWTGLPESISEFFWDPQSQTLQLLKKTVLTYDKLRDKKPYRPFGMLSHPDMLKYGEQKIIAEDIFDATDTCRYTLYTKYDAFDRVQKKTTPLGQENTYLYDEMGNLLEVKEAGSSRKIYRYDSAGRQIACSDPESGTTITYAYDSKSRILVQTDPQGNRICHTYDCFGNRTSTQFADEPLAEFAYDVLGNLTMAKKTQGETTLTSYNLLRKPTLITQPDGSQTRHIYNKNGTLARTILPDATEIHYRYDLHQHVIEQTIYSKDGVLLTRESWVYTAFHPISHTDPRGLTTRFIYDGAGRKVAETAMSRKTSYSYDALGFLEKTDTGISSLIQKRNAAGFVEEQWEEDREGRIENRMRFFYDPENRKKQAIRTTSCGDATDRFDYRNNKLEWHTDPNGDVTQFIYNEHFINEDGQTVLQKTSIDPIGNASIETYTPQGKISLIEKKNPSGQTVFKEEFSYDLSGNKTKRVSHIYRNGAFLKTIVASWEYDVSGRAVAEIESGQKKTSFEYDLRGRIKKKLLPNQSALIFSYDGVDRLLELTSSDGTIHLQYVYEQGPDPIQIIDLVQQTTLQRTYNPFGQITQEITAQGWALHWNYDSNGRCTSFTLPDASSVCYSYSGAHMSAVQRKTPTGQTLFEHHYRAFDANGHVSEELLGDLGSIHTTHDLLERPSGQSSSWFSETISYGPSGLIENTQNSLLGGKTYHYDSLNQLTYENEQAYLFDSMGNPANCQTNDLNQIVATDTCELIYDANGNPTTRLADGHATSYSYDALNRLSEINYGDKRKVHYCYDPLSRLLSKEVYEYRDADWQLETKIFYLYDKDYEIGTLDEEGCCLTFKTLGLGIQGDIGAAIAVETQNVLFIPLHDFRGNIIALLSAKGCLVEQYTIDAYGNEPSSSQLCPWRFCSKRSEENLVFFGLRFYDPALKRWLTPDPLGFSDTSNLYVYVCNNPTNRLDLLGLFSFDFKLYYNTPDINVYIPISQCVNQPTSSGVLCKGKINDVSADFYVFNNQWHKLQFSPEEQAAGQIDLAEHFQELVPTNGRSFVMASYGNGVDTTLDEFNAENNAIAQSIGGTFMLSLYNPTQGTIRDLHRTSLERHGVETPSVCKTRQFMAWVSDQLQTINPESLWLVIPHSENGVITKRAIESMTPEQQQTLRRNLYIYAVGPAEPLPKDQGASVVNVFSEKDYVTGFGLFGYADKYIGNPDYEIRVLKCLSQRSDRFLKIADHGFLKPTYMNAWKGQIDDLRLRVGFYDGNKKTQTR